MWDVAYVWHIGRLAFRHINICRVYCPRYWRGIFNLIMLSFPSLQLNHFVMPLFWVVNKRALYKMEKKFVLARKDTSWKVTRSRVKVKRSFFILFIYLKCLSKLISVNEGAEDITFLHKNKPFFYHPVCLDLTRLSVCNNVNLAVILSACSSISDINECVTGKHKCSQLCVNNKGNYTCACKPGYQLADDQITCTGTITRLQI